MSERMALAVNQLDYFSTNEIATRLIQGRELRVNIRCNPYDMMGSMLHILQNMTSMSFVALPYLRAWSFGKEDGFSSTTFGEIVFIAASMMRTYPTTIISRTALMDHRISAILFL
jgi:hypothetical protein